MAHERTTVMYKYFCITVLYNVLDGEKSCAEVRRQCYKQEKSGSYDEIKISFMIVLLKYEEKSNFGKKVAFEWNHDLMFYHLSLLCHLKQLQRSVLPYLAGYRLSLPCLLMNCLVFILSLEVVSIKRFSLQDEKEHANIPNLVSEGSVVSSASKHAGDTGELTSQLCEAITAVSLGSSSILNVAVDTNLSPFRTEHSVQGQFVQSQESYRGDTYQALNFRFIALFCG